MSKVTRFVKTARFGILLRCSVSLEAKECTISARDRQTRATFSYWKGDILLGNQIIGSVGENGTEVSDAGFNYIYTLKKARANEIIEDVLKALEVHSIPYQRDRAIAKFDRQLQKEDQASADRAIGSQIMEELLDRRVTPDTNIVAVNSSNGKVPVAK